MIASFPSAFSCPTVFTLPTPPTLPTAPVHPATAFFVFEGDSISNVSPGGLSWPDRLLASAGFLLKGPAWNLSLSGDTAYNMDAGYFPQTGQIFSPGFAGKTGYYFLLAGCNDIVFSIGTAATVYANLASLWAKARAQGYKVVAFTIMPRSDYTGPMETERLAINAFIVGAPSLYDYFADAAAWLPTPGDGAVYSDGVHPTAAGMQTLANNVAALFAPPTP